MIEVDMRAIGWRLAELAEEVGETGDAAVLRMGVSMARNLAQVTEPKRSTVASRKRKAAAALNKVLRPVPARYLRSIEEGRADRLRFGGRWVEVNRGRVLRSEAEIDRCVDESRGADGRTRKLPPEQRYLVTEAAYRKAVTRRAKRWGVAKGGWLGAGMELAKRQVGLDKVGIGKNYLAWAQKHARVGTGNARFGQGASEVTLTNFSAGAAHAEGLRKGDIARSEHQARKATFRFYGRALASMGRRSSRFYSPAMRRR